jgi:hypothetical protein
VHVAGAGAASDAVSALRQQKRPAAAAELESLLRELHRLRFAPAEPYDAQRIIDRVRAFVGMLAPGRSWKGRGALIIALAMAPAALIAIQQDPADDFAVAVQHYERGDYVAAANAFHDYARAVPQDATGWYDLGIAAHRAGDPGRAAWAWLRTVSIAPRDRDARFNLRATGAGAALTRVQPIDWLNTSERALVAAIGWWLLVLGIATIVLRRPRRWIIVAPGAVILTLAALTSVAEAARAPVVTPLGQGAQLFAAPTTRDAALGDLPAGAVARVVEQRDQWLRVRTEEGTDAWVERSVVASP